MWLRQRRRCTLDRATRLINIELRMVPTRSGVHIGGTDFMGMFREGKTFADYPHLEPAARAMLDELAWWAQTLKAARATTDQLIEEHA